MLNSSKGRSLLSDVGNEKADERREGGLDLDRLIDVIGLSVLMFFSLIAVFACCYSLYLSSQLWKLL